MEKIQNKIHERIKKGSQFYHLVKGLIMNKDINKKYKLDIFKNYFNRILSYGAETWTTIKREDSIFNPWKFLKTI